MNIKESVIRLLKENPTMSYSDMAKRIGCGKTSVQRWCNKLEIKRDRKEQQKINNTNRNKPIVISNKAKEILIGTLLGDSHISKYCRDCEPVRILNSNISCGHSLKQKDYVLHLQSLLNEAEIKTNFREDDKVHITKIKGREISTIGRCDLSTIRNIEFNAWRDIWYPNGTKIVPKEIYEYFSPVTLAIWFMDDGSKNKFSYYLHTEGFQTNDVKFLQEILFEKFGLISTIQRLREQPVLYISMKSRSKFKELILPYMCPSMMYKLFET